MQGTFIRVTVFAKCHYNISKAFLLSHLPRYLAIFISRTSKCAIGLRVVQAWGSLMSYPLGQKNTISSLDIK